MPSPSDPTAIPRAFLNFAREYSARPKPGGKVVVVFSASGGVGRTSIAMNLAMAFRMTTAEPVVLVDGSLNFGDVALGLNFTAEAKTLANLVGRFDKLDSGVLESTLVAHSSGIHVLLAPPTPESTELITGAHIGRVLDLLRERYAFVVVDTWPSFQEQVIAMLDAADTVLLVTTLEVASLKNTRMFLQIADLLGYPTDKVQLVANRVDEHSIGLSEAAAALGREITQVIGWDRQLFVQAAHQATPLVWSDPASLRATEIRALAESLRRVWEPPNVEPGHTALSASTAVGHPRPRPGPTRFALWLAPLAVTLFLWRVIDYLAASAVLVFPRADPLVFIGLFWGTIVAASGLSHHLGDHLGVYAEIKTAMHRFDRWLAHRMSQFDHDHYLRWPSWKKNLAVGVFLVAFLVPFVLGMGWLSAITEPRTCDVGIYTNWPLVPARSKPTEYCPYQRTDDPR